MKVERAIVVMLTMHYTPNIDLAFIRADHYLNKFRCASGGKKQE